MWACRLIVTAIDERWAQVAAREVCGYGTSVIGCDAEAGIERVLSEDETPDGRPGVSLLFFAFNAKALQKAMPNRVGQCLMTCPTTAVYDGMSAETRGPGKEADEACERLELGSRIRYFGDGFQKSKVIGFPEGDRRLWRVPVMDGEFTVEDSIGAVKAIGGGNLLVCGRDQRSALHAASEAVDAIAETANVIAPFPGGVVRSGSKVGSRYKALFASSNDAFCPTLRGATKSELRDGVGAVYEIVINGLSEAAIAGATRQAIEAATACDAIIAISAGNYGGKLGKFHFKLHEVMAPQAKAVSAPIDAGEPDHRDAGHSRGYALRYVAEGVAPIDGSFLRPDVLCDLPLDDVRAVAVPVGRSMVPLGNLFEVSDQGPGRFLDVLSPPVLDRLGAGMTGGLMSVRGDVGDDLGCGMSGGRIDVNGNAGHRVGGPDPHGNSNRGMAGGTIRVWGDAGDYVGLRMRRGLVCIMEGRVGKSPGYRMLAGTIMLRQPLSSVEAPGLQMQRGTLLFENDSRSGEPLPPELELGPNGPHLAFDGEVAPSSAPAFAAVLRQIEQLAVGDADGYVDFDYPSIPETMRYWHTGRLRLYRGDRATLNRGELVQWLPPVS